ncbi:MAG: DUF4870 domain-containing protein [Chitinophagaceae bacterium]
METENSRKYVSTDDSTVYTPTSDERTMAILSHILTLVAPVLAPLIIYLIKKDDSKYVTEHAKESLNFQITVMLVYILLAITIIGLILIWVVYIIALVFVILATIKASDNRIYRYPMSFRLIK